MKAKNISTLQYILEGLIPYTDANFKLAYKPSLFFNELERLSHNRTGRNINSNTLSIAYFRAKKRGYITERANGTPKLSDLGKQKLSIFKPKKLIGAKLLLVFDIQESFKAKRNEFRRILRVLKFNQVQKSVWVSEYDSRDYLNQEIERLKIKSCVIVYEARII